MLLPTRHAWQLAIIGQAVITFKSVLVSHTPTSVRNSKKTKIIIYLQYFINIFIPWHSFCCVNNHNDYR